MSSNAQLLLSSIINERHQALAAEMSLGDFFELFSASELLKSYDLSVDEITGGLMGGGNDGGIDCFYAFVDGEPLDDTYTEKVSLRGQGFELVVIQCKYGESFTGVAIDKLISSVGTLFDFGRNMGRLSALYNERLLNRASLVRDYYTKNIAKISSITVRYCYFSRAEHIHESLLTQVDTLKETSKRSFPGADITFSFFGANEILKLIRTPRAEWVDLPIYEGPLAISNSGFIGLVRLVDFFRFATDEHRNRRRSLFLENVRDYEGRNSVNLNIAKSLRTKGAEEFWTLNNGITILADQVRPGYRVLALRNPKVVNGLQTTIEIVDHFRAIDFSPDGDDNRSVVVRVVIPSNEASRDRIIIATNSQSPISGGVLRATDPLQKDIEDYLGSVGLHYERRRNSHRNEGYELETIVTIPYLARSMAAIALRQPYVAVRINSHKRLLANDHLYESIFSRDVPLGAYLNCIRVIKWIEKRLQVPPSLDPDTEVYLGKSKQPAMWWAQWHIALYATCLNVGNARFTLSDLAEMDISKLTTKSFDRAAAQTVKLLGTMRNEAKRTVYQMAKTHVSADRLLAMAEAEIIQRAKSSEQAQ